MHRVLFIQNGESEGPGLFGTVLGGLGVDLETVHAWRGDAVPGSIGGCDGIAIGGGAMGANDTAEFPFLNDELALLREARAMKVPVLGLCLGAQLMAAAYGGDVFRNKMKEIGFFDLYFTEAAQHDPLWRGHTVPLQPVSWHRDAFSLPPGAIHLASSGLTENQMFSLDGILYGMQFHLEIDRPLLAEMVNTDDGGGLPKYGIDPQQFLLTAETVLPRVEAVARDVFARWTRLPAA